MTDTTPATKKRKSAATDTAAAPITAVDGDAKMNGPDVRAELPDMIIVQMLSNEGSVPGIYGVPVKELTKEVHVWLRGDTRDCDYKDEQALAKARKDKDSKLVGEIRGRREAREKIDTSAERAYELARVELHEDFNAGDVIMMSGTVLYSPDPARKPVGKFAGALIYRERD